MKFVKKLTALFLAIVMTMAMGITAFAADTYTITVKGDSGHTYEAYQVFTGDLNGNTLSNIKWGAGVDGSALLTALKSDATLKSSFESIANDDKYAAEKVAEVLATKTNDSEFAQAFAKVAGANVKTPAQGTSSEKVNNPADGDSVYTISGLAAGYYVVMDKAGTAPTDDAYTRYILEVVKNVEVEAKVDVPTVDKDVKDGNEWKDANTASIGDKVEFKVESKVPDMTGYTKYFFILNDTMSKGLTFNEDVKITIDGTELVNTEEKTYYTVTSEAVMKDGVATGETAIKIVFNDFIQHQAQKGKAIVVTYSATLNEKADLTTTGNPNTVTLTYSNNPNITPNGENEPSDEDKKKGVTGETPKSETVTYSTGIELLKVDATNHKTKLPGAAFKITGDAVKVVLTNEEMYVKANDGTYWLLKDGTYTTDAPITSDYTDPDDGTTVKANTDLYDSTTQKYKKETVVNKETVKQEFQTIAVSGTDGIVKFEGLGEGEYTITEIAAPDGYNLLKEPIKVVISADATLDTVTWTFKDGTGTDANVITTTKVTDDKGHELYQITVENNKGSVLPSTGGMGTAVIYVAGIAMIVAAGVVVIARKRMA